ncbi:glycoprotein-N-acetylgalactosamine 3-beta-galactosyltransferase 1-like [Octopus sinensis]|uniref:N-acetylgalactosaminide beta-1,3-galactosyltransferase n=1 Tax=Octopus sinensis TaxID=2607531 RepID=A0A6P7U748_9MOLL|nr:glycoprotein-N-acetylgalactosamine 3-beta-galactosyltransferase 1-like [Octopus sinensis]
MVPSSTFSRIAFNIVVLGRTDSHRHVIFCMILTSKNNYKTRGRAVLDTWGKRCDKTFYFVGKVIANESFITSLNINDDYEHLPSKTYGGLKYIEAKFHDEYDWIVKADDDTYIIVNNLRQFLVSEDHSRPVSFGLKFYKYFPNGYFSGGASYILSREAVKKVISANKAEVVA